MTEKYILVFIQYNNGKKDRNTLTIFVDSLTDLLACHWFYCLCTN